MECGIYMLICGVSTVLEALHQTFVERTDVSQRAKLSIYQLICTATLTYSLEFWVVT